MIYELSKAIAEGSVGNYLREDWKQTGRDLKKYAPVLAKLSYPITGNLSIELRDALEESLGKRSVEPFGKLEKNVFDSKYSGVVSAYTNAAVFGCLFAYLAPEAKVVQGAIIGGITGSIHALARRIVGDTENKMSASLLGWAASVSIGIGLNIGWGVYDGIKSRRESRGKE